MNPAVSRGLAEHMLRHRRRIAAGQGRLGWKVAFNPPAVQERLGIPHSLVAGLTRVTLLEPGVPHSLSGGRAVALEAEVAVRLGRDLPPDASLGDVAAAVEQWAAAIEVVDFTRSLDELEAVLSEGVFHRALLIGPWRAPRESANLAGVRARVAYDGETLCDVDAYDATGDAPAVLRHVARLLAEHGEGLAAGDVVILGSMNSVTLARPDSEFTVELSGIGSASLSLER